MLDKSILNKYDKSEMHKIYDIWPDIASESYKSNHDPVDFKDIDHVIFAGMGGSGTIGDTLSSVLSKTKIHVCVVKGYHLPKTVDENTLVVTTSVSGNTVETISALNSAKKLGCKTIAFSSGGKIAEYCKRNNIEYRKFKQLHSPRASFTVFLYSMLQVLDSVLPIKKEDVNESIGKLQEYRQEISSSNLTKKNTALEIAKWIRGIPVIYYPWGLQAAAIRFINSLQENAKTHAMAEDIIEACHNGIVSWEKQTNVNPILVKGEDYYMKTKERWKIFKEYLKIKEIDYKEVLSCKGSILSKLVTLIYLLDYTTIYLAVISKIDPSPVHSIDFIKQRL